MAVFVASNLGTISLKGIHDQTGGDHKDVVAKRAAPAVRRPFFERREGGLVVHPFAHLAVLATQAVLRIVVADGDLLDVDALQRLGLLGHRRRCCSP